MAEELARRLDAYLDGELETSEARRLERELASSEAARALAEELLVRDLLRALGPEAPPAGLCERIEAELQLGPERARRAGEAETQLHRAH